MIHYMFAVVEDESQVNWSTCQTAHGSGAVLPVQLSSTLLTYKHHITTNHKTVLPTLFSEMRYGIFYCYRFQ